MKLLYLEAEKNPKVSVLTVHQSFLWKDLQFYVLPDLQKKIF